MGELVFGLVVGILLISWSFRVAYRMGRPHPRRKQTFGIQDFYPTHHWGYEAVEERLAECEEILRRVGADHRATTLGYLDAVRDDFQRVEKLLNHGVKFMLELTFESELRRAWLSIHYRFEFKLARFKVRCGIDATGQLRSLTQRVRLMARMADDLVNQVAREQGLPVLENDLNR
jgi:hypothetical protein